MFVNMLAMTLMGALWSGPSAGAQQGPGCSLTQGADPSLGPVRIPYASKGSGEEAGKSPRDASAVLSLIGDIPLPGRPVRFDYQSQDPQSGRLYISHMNDGHVEVFDTRARKVVGRVANTPTVTGVLVVPQLKKLYASVAGRRYVAVIDIDSLTVRATPGPIGFPDGIA